jgi:hypothetical protein
MRNRMKWILLGLLTLSGCKPFVGEEILNGSVDCSPPCWMSIIPGETATNDAYRILSEADKGQISTTKIFKDGEIWWRSGSNYKANIFQNENKTIERIEIDFRPEYDTLDKYIRKLGSPDLLTIINVVDGYFFPLFIYQEEGIAIFGSDNEIAAKDGSLEYSINSDLGIYKIILFQPTLNIDLLQPVINLGGIDIETSKLYQWEGYGKYTIPK